jgi:hypothetical protein
MKKKINKLIDKSLRFHHRDIHGELENLKQNVKLKAQVKSRFYYIFWGIATLAVVTGQLYVGTGYRVMTESVNQLTWALSRAIK